MAYPTLDRFMINMAIDLDEMNKKKWGEDYNFEDHVEEIFPEVESDSAETLVDAQPEIIDLTSENESTRPDSQADTGEASQGEQIE